ncbi:MAG: hypothetical protein WKF77_12510, partial [Planctomycetaceae bacterium]
MFVCGVAFVLSLAVAKSKEQHPNSELPGNDVLFARGPTLGEQARQLAPCLFLTLMSLVIVLLSWTVQPALVARYAVTGVLGFGAIFAILLSLLYDRQEVAI